MFQLVALNKQITIYEILGKLHACDLQDSRGELSTIQYINRFNVGAVYLSTDVERLSS